jgi:hypothetical protein
MKNVEKIARQIIAELQRDKYFDNAVLPGIMNGDSIRNTKNTLAKGISLLHRLETVIKKNDMQRVMTIAFPRVWLNKTGLDYYFLIFSRRGAWNHWKFINIPKYQMTDTEKNVVEKTNAEWEKDSNAFARELEVVNQRLAWDELTSEYAKQYENDFNKKVQHFLTNRLDSSEIE